MSSSKPIPPSINHSPLAHVGRIVAIASGKGGVGKSTTTVNLAHALTHAGNRVGILDADIYGPSIPRMLQLDTNLRPEMVDGQMIPPISYGIRAMSIGLVMGEQAAILRAPMITKALVQMLRLTRWGTAEEPLDYLLIDMPPGTGDINLSLAQNVKLDGAMIVTTPQEVSVMDARKALHAMRKLGVAILGVIENMSYFTDPAGTRHALFGTGGGKKLASEEGVNFLGEIAVDTALGIAADTGAIPEKQALLPYISIANLLKH
ncbi:MAG: Mrp/NBP35 family ATP-binding protein [Alphaproteobacteria bacterium]|nr:Mrp/NBP35 family ATP-binding protein [Alphaproteobacteria bacterium]